MALQHPLSTCMPELDTRNMLSEADFAGALGDIGNITCTERGTVLRRCEHTKRLPHEPDHLSLPAAAKA